MRKNSRRPKTVNIIDSISTQTRTPSLQNVEIAYIFALADQPLKHVPAYKHHRTEQFRNKQNQMNLPTCLRNSLLVMLVVLGYRHNLQKLRGKKVRCIKLSNQADEGAKMG